MQIVDISDVACYTFKKYVLLIVRVGHITIFVIYYAHNHLK